MMAECAPSEDYFKLVEYQMENQKMILEQAQKGEARAEYDKIGKLAGLETQEDVPFYINGDPYKGKQDAETLTQLISDMHKKGLSKLPTTIPKG